MSKRLAPSAGSDQLKSGLKIDSDGSPGFATFRPNRRTRKLWSRVISRYFNRRPRGLHPETGTVPDPPDAAISENAAYDKLASSVDVGTQDSSVSGAGQ